MSEQATEDVKEQVAQDLRRAGDKIITLVKEHDGYSAVVIPSELNITIYRHDKYDNKGQKQGWSTYEVTITIGKTLVTSSVYRVESVRDLIVKVLQNLW
jgi:hypothetical protein